MFFNASALEWRVFLAPDLTRSLRAALETLRIERVVLGVHDSSFPSTADEDVGRGTPYGKGARALLELAASLGFDGLQMGPQGDTSLVNPSPYDGAHFTKSPLLLALATLAEDPAWRPLVEGLLAPRVAGRPAGPADRTQHAYAWRGARATLATLHARFRAGEAAAGPLAVRFEAFRARWASVLRADSLYEALSEEHGTDDWQRWPVTGAARLDQALWLPGAADARAAEARRAAIEASRAGDVERHLFGQFALDEQHRAFRDVAARHHLALLGDLQIGFSHRDVWSQRALFRSDYLLGAPPSRTNPLGQAWGYPVLDTPREPARTLALLLARVERMLVDFDGLRVDHPHGLVCPWVYRADDPDPAAAVGRGARLYDSPGLPDHPALAALAIPRLDQLSSEPGIARYADDWVLALDDEQVDRYGFLFDAILARWRAAGRADTDVVCEVLSTWPYPLRRVMQRHGLGRFCVTQKADLARPADVYRSENASPRDWIMVGNHDTPPIWSLADAWHGTPPGHARALALAHRLGAHEALRPRLARWIEADAHHLAHAMLAELFIGPARRVSMFFSDWLGLRDIYNRPGVVHPDNWLLRMTSSFAEDYRVRLAAGAAFNPPLALAMALAASPSREIRLGAAPLVRRLLEGARQLTPALDDELVAILTLSTA
jgi:4-alpha-glucanotransferase